MLAWMRRLFFLPYTCVTIGFILVPDLMVQNELALPLILPFV